MDQYYLTYHDNHILILTKNSEVERLDLEKLFKIQKVDSRELLGVGHVVPRLTFEAKDYGHR